VDRYGEHLVVQAQSQGVDRLTPRIVEILVDLVRPSGILARNDGRVRQLEGLDSSVTVLYGDVPPLVTVREGRIEHEVDVWHGQKTGLFLDQRENRAAAREYAHGRLLDCFSYHGAFALQLASVIVQSRLVEDEPSSTVKRKPVREFLRELPRILREDRGFRMFLIASAFLIAAAMPIGFFTVFGLRKFHAGEEAVGQFTLLIVGSQVVGALLIGFVADHFGHKVGLISAGTGLLCANVVAIAAPTLAWFSVLYPFLGIYLGTEVMVRYNLSAEFAPAAQRSTYVGLMNTVLSPLYLLALVAGVFGEGYGFVVVFLLGAVFSAAGIFLLARFVVDPRRVSLSP